MLLLYHHLLNKLHTCPNYSFLSMQIDKDALDKPLLHPDSFELSAYPPIIRLSALAVQPLVRATKPPPCSIPVLGLTEKRWFILSVSNRLLPSIADEQVSSGQYAVPIRYTNTTLYQCFLNFFELSQALFDMY